MKIKIPSPTNDNTEEVEFGAQIAQDRWLPYLTVVIANPHRLVGLVGTEWKSRARSGEAFPLYKTTVWASQIGFQPVPPQEGKPGGTAVQVIRNMIPFDVLAPVEVMWIQDRAAAFSVAEQGEDMKRWVMHSWLNLIDPPRIQQASIVPPQH
jgi:hypothetical protein